MEILVSKKDILRRSGQTTVPALEMLESFNKNGQVRMEIVTKAKRSCTAYEKPGTHRHGRERPSLFISHAGQFQEADMELYEKRTCPLL